MTLYAILDRVWPRSYLAKVMAVALLFGHGPLVAYLALSAMGLIPAAAELPAIAVVFGLGVTGIALGLSAILRPVERLAAALAAFEAGRPSPPLPEGHADPVGRLMGRMTGLIRTAESRIDAAERAAERDPLTGLLNRRGFERALMARRATGERGALIMLDLDHFKRVNDGFGHAAGDRVLRDVATLLDAHLRRPDLAARFGGEEFVLYLAGAGREAAMQVAERLRMAVEDEIDITGQTQTASFGVAAWPTGESLGAALGRADAAVYRAKSSGRNRVCGASTGLEAEFHEAGLRPWATRCGGQVVEPRGHGAGSADRSAGRPDWTIRH